MWIESKKSNNMSFYQILVGFLLLALIACESQDKKTRIYYINSYHQGYGSSDDIMEGIHQVLDDERIDLNVFFMDSKRHGDSDYLLQKVDTALAEIAQFDPDVIIASDDNAVKYLIEPHFKTGPIPVVFCGVNWSAQKYGLPTEYVTGMLEVLPLKENLQIMLDHFPEAKKLTVLSENTESERKNTEMLDTLYKNMGFSVSYQLVDDFAAWKTAFKSGNEKTDIIYFSTHGGIKNWDKTEAIEFITRHISVPVVTCDDFMMAYAVFGLTKIASEQGVWASKKALQIANGTAPDQIPLTRNQQSQMWLNQSLANQIGWQPTGHIMDKARILE